MHKPRTPDGVWFKNGRSSEQVESRMFFMRRKFVTAPVLRALGLNELYQSQASSACFVGARGYTMLKSRNSRKGLKRRQAATIAAVKVYVVAQKDDQVFESINNKEVLMALDSMQRESLYEEVVFGKVVRKLTEASKKMTVTTKFFSDGIKTSSGGGSHVYIRLKLPSRDATIGPRAVFASEDAGVRKMSSVIDSERCGSTFLNSHGQDGLKMKDLALQVSQLESRMQLKVEVDAATSTKLVTHRSRAKMRKAKRRLYDRGKQMMRNAHYLRISYLAATCEYLIQPGLAVSGMICKEDRKIGKATVKAMLTWRHYKYTSRCSDQARRQADFTVIRTDEINSTVTCSQWNCGHKRTSFTGERFICLNPECGFTADRDFNAGKNIVVKFVIYPK